MRPLLLRLSEFDSQAEAALRVIAAFDALVQHRASMDALVRTTAALAECTAGIEVAQTGVSLRFDPDGHQSPPSETESVAWSRLEIQDSGEAVGVVWLERQGPESGLHDELILERFSLAAATLRQAPIADRDPASVETTLSDEADDIQRSTALRRLGLSPDLTVRAVAFASADRLDYAPGARVHSAVRAALAADRSSRSAVLGRVGVVIQPVDGSLPGRVAGVLLGVGPATPALELARSWRGAREALRLGRALPMLVGDVADWTALGSLTALVSVAPVNAERNEDVRRLASHVADGFEDDVVALEAFLARGSLRGAGEVLHRHHSSVASRITRLESALNLDLTSTTGLVRATVALVLVRLRDEPAV